MRALTTKYSASRISPSNEMWLKKWNISEVYTHMFLNDFCGYYSIYLSSNKYVSASSKFYNIEPVSELLKKILTFNAPRELDYMLNESFSCITRTLVEYGKAFVEIVIWKDKDGNIAGITFEVLKPMLSFSGIKRRHFISILNNKKLRLYSIEKKKIIVFDLHELGYSRHYFRRMLKKINRLNFSKVPNLLVERDSGFDFKKYNENAEYKLLKNTKKIYWYGRDRSNQYMNDFYLIWRESHLLKLRERFLNYILSKVNGSLKSLNEYYGFAGIITTNCRKVDFSHDFSKLQSGEINLSQFGDILYEVPKRDE